MFKSERFEDRPFKPVSIFVMAISDTRTLETDTSGALLEQMITEAGHICVERTVVTDNIYQIRERVVGLVAHPDLDVIITTGGTGFTGRDVTPEAIEPILNKRMDGFSVLFHQYSATKIGTSTVQSRALAGLIGKTFIFCLPGSSGAVRDAWEGIIRDQLDYRHKPCNFVELMPRLLER